MPDHPRWPSLRAGISRAAPRERARKSCICTIFREGQIRAHRVESVDLMLEPRRGQAAIRLDQSWASKLRAAPNDQAQRPPAGNARSAATIADKLSEPSACPAGRRFAAALWLGHSELGFLPSAVPNMENFDSTCLLRNIVKDAIGAEHDFAQRPACPSRIRRTDEREGRKDPHVVQNPSSHPPCRLRVMPCDVGTNLMKVRDRLVGPDHFEVHALAQDSSNCSASSCVLVRPAATSARPRRMAAIIHNSSVISSSEALSGSLRSASRTACLSVMARKLRPNGFPCKRCVDWPNVQGERQPPRRRNAYAPRPAERVAEARDSRSAKRGGCSLQ
jgi:hypothetical protein